MQRAYVRGSKCHSVAAQKAALKKAGFTDWSEEGGGYIDEKPKRGEATWYWREKVILACRPGHRDEVWVAGASVWGASLADALGALERLTSRGGVLVIAGSEERFYWHPDAALGLALAQRMARENAQLNTAAAREKRRENTRKKKRRLAEKMAEIKSRWLNEPDTTSEQIAKETGYTRAYLNRKFGARGTERFVGGRKETS